MPTRNRLIPAFCVAACALLGGAAASCSEGRKDEPKKRGPAARELTLFVTTDLQGTIEPCGCTTDPHGGLARTAALLSEARQSADHPVLHLDGGSLLYSKIELGEELAAQEELKAELIREAMKKHFRPAAVGLGPYDLARGAKAVHPPRQAANVPKDAGVPLAPPELIEAGGVKLGVFGVVDPAALSPAGIEATDPKEAAARAVEDLRGRGADVVVALAHMTRQKASELARQVSGIDFIVVGQTVKASKLVIKHDPIQIGDTWLIEPADRGQVLSRLDLTVRGDGAFSDAIGEARAEIAVADLDEQMESLETRLAEWKADPDAERSFLTRKEEELSALKAKKASLKKSPIQAPDKGRYFTLTQIPVKKRLDCHEEVQAAKVAFDKAAGKANLERFAKVKPPPAPEGESGYVGAESCEMCHAEQAEFWKKTKHHEAWETLEKYGKQFNLDCVYCHVTGFDDPGGPNLAHLDGFRDVQCEECHGPGSRHADSGEVSLITRTPTEDTCVGCHNEEHSDTFDFEAYLRDVTGEGHGAEFRKKLGDGPTGRELRAAGLKKAGQEIGENCLK